MKISLAFLCLAILFSCKKNDVEPLTPILQNTSTDSTYLDQIIQSDTAGIHSQQIVSRFLYDNVKRVVAITDSNNTTNTLNFPSFTKRTDLFYVGTDSLPNKSLTILHQLASSSSRPELFDTTEIFYFYNAAGKKIKDSSLLSSKSVPIASPAYTDRSIIVSNYTYATNSISGQIIKYTSLNPVMIQSVCSDTAFLDANGNITRNVFYKALKLKRTFFQYDNQPNPYRQIAQLAPTLPQTEYGPEINDGGFGAKNNIMYIAVDSYPNINTPVFASYNVEYKRQYQTNGYPKISKEGYQVTKRFLYKTR